MEMSCHSVPGGWRTDIGAIFVGPVCNTINELWAWQKRHAVALDFFAHVVNQIRVVGPKNGECLTLCEMEYTLKSKLDAAP